MVRQLVQVVILAPLLTALNTGSPPPESQPLSEAVNLADLLNAPDIALRRRAVGSLLERRASNIQALIQTASQEDLPAYDTPQKRVDSPKRMAISCLGNLRADDDKSLRVLWNNLTYRTSLSAGTLYEILDPGSYYPAAAALVRIGKPACERAWFELEMANDPVRRDLAIFVLDRVEGDEIAQLLIARRLQKLAGEPDVLTSASPYKRNLERARQWINLYGKDARPSGRPPAIGEP